MINEGYLFLNRITLISKYSQTCWSFDKGVMTFEEQTKINIYCQSQRHYKPAMIVGLVVREFVFDIFNLYVWLVYCLETFSKRKTLNLFHNITAFQNIAFALFAYCSILCHYTLLPVRVIDRGNLWLICYKKQVIVVLRYILIFFPSNNIWQKNNIKKGNKIVFGIYITPELKDIEMCSRKEFKTQLIFLESW